MNKRIVIILALVLTMCIVVVSCTACNFDWALGGDTDGDQTGNTDGGNTDGTGNGDTDGGDDTTPTEPTFVDKVNEFVGGLLGSRKLEKVVGVYVVEGIFYAYATFDDGKIYKIGIYRATKPITSIEEGMSVASTDRKVFIVNSYETVPYDSATALIQSGDFGQRSQMQDYLDEGYVFSVVSSQTAKGSNDGHFYINATYKATNYEETKYIQQVMSVALTEEASNSAEKNYIESVRDPNARIVRDMSFVELTGDAYTYAEQLDAQQSAEK